MNNTFFWKIILGAFTALTLYAVIDGNLMSVVDGITMMGPWGWQISFDLVIALCVCNFWIWRDAEKKVINPLPYLIATFLTGSIAILFYLALHAHKTGNTAQVPAE